jgi:XTP/dITP diphosphohydrolase
VKLILASNNANKLREFSEILAGTGIDLVSQREAGCDFEVDETGETFEENAFLKADAVMKASGLPAVADDSGLEVDALGGAPGVRSARYTGSHDDTDLNRRRFLLAQIGDAENAEPVFFRDLLCFPEWRHYPRARHL